MFATVRLQNEAKVIAYEFPHGRLGHIVLDQNHRLELRVLDDGGLLSRHHRMQKRLNWLQVHFAHSLYFGWIKDIACEKARRNSRMLREFLAERLVAGRVYRKTLDLQIGEYRFRLVQPEEIPVLLGFLREEHQYCLYCYQGNDPTAMALVHLGTVPT